MTNLLATKPSGEPTAHVVLAHGAGAPMDTQFMNSIAEGLAVNGLFVSRFEFPYMAMRRTDGKRRGPDGPLALLECWRSVIAETLGELPLFIGGKSMGGRIASLVGDEPGIAGVICFGYPFHPPGRPEKLRTGHLESFPVPMLIVQGERDPFGTPDEVAGYELDKRIQIVWIPDGDHSFKPRVKSGFTEAGNLSLAVNFAEDFVKRVLL
jgi:predicted alpha/beta-hydrolase family hydrolase